MAFVLCKKLILWAFSVCFWLCFLLSNNNNNGVLVEGSHKIYSDYQNMGHAKQNINPDDLKPVFHFRPTYNWINDPNGPMYFKGIYHLFYQYNPYGSVWGNIIWAHSVSTDLINWISLVPAIYPSKEFDRYGCWSGSATVLPGDRPVILYTGIIDKHDTQVQNYAIPANISDPYLKEWVKPDDNPLIVAEPGVNASAFRDPTTAWLLDGHWRIGIGSRRGERGVTLLYRSRDFKKWVKAKHPLHSVAGTGNWECPDFFPVGKRGNKEGLDTSVNGEHVKHVHKVSLDRTRFEYYTLGTYYYPRRGGSEERYVPDNDSVDSWKGLRLDYGNFYASKSFFDPSKNRRIIWGWANESDSQADDASKGWAGIQLIPREVWLDKNEKQLVQWPVKELESLREKKVSISNEELKEGEKIKVKGITAAQADVEVTFSFPNLEKAETFDPSWENLDAQDVCARRGSDVRPGGVGPFGLATLASKNLEEYTPVFFRIFKHHQQLHHKILMCSDATKSSLKVQGLYKPSFAGFVDLDLTDNKISLRTLIDHSVVESFGGEGKTCITSRVYPTIAVGKKANLYVFNNGTESIKIDNLHAWNLRASQKMSDGV